MLGGHIKVRAALRGDLPELLNHMRSLAEFESYISEFRVDEKELLDRAFGRTPECYIFVAESGSRIVGYAVTLLILFTYDLKSTVVLKELFVEKNSRGKGTGSALFKHVATWALNQGSGRLKWDVLRGNDEAEKFYQRHGGRPDSKWIPYVIEIDELKSASI